MKLVLTMDEVREAIVNYVSRKRQILVQPKDISIVSHAEGQWEDRETIFDGFQVELPPN